MMILISTPAVSGLSEVLRDLPPQSIVEETIIVGAIKHPGAHVKFDQGVDLVGHGNIFPEISVLRGYTSHSARN